MSELKRELGLLDSTMIVVGSMIGSGVFILRMRNPRAERPYKTWGYPVVPALYIVAASAICVDLLVFKPMYTWPGIGIVLAGLPVYYAWKRVSTA